LLDLVFQIRDENLCAQAAGGENDRLEAAFQERSRDPPRFVDIRAADTELLVHDRRVVENEVLFAPRCAAPVDEVRGAHDELFGELFRIGDGRGGANELRIRPVEPADAAQATQDVREV